MLDGHVSMGRDIVSVFESWASAAPQAEAVVSDSERLSYRELNARANVLAHRLVERGVTPGSRVGIVLSRSTCAVVAMLGILKAGALYVPIEPAYPRERIAFMLRDAEVHLALTSQALQPELPAVVTYLSVGNGPTPGARATDALLDERNLELARSPAACVMYTSGTTGRPKGALIPHRGVVRLVCGAGYLRVAPRERILHHATCAFDAATFEIWFGLLNGGTVVLAPDGPVTLDSLENLIVRGRITTLLLTTAMFHVVAAERPHALSTIEQLLVGGDVLDAKHVRGVLTRFPYLRVVNGYGPTENTTFTCCFVMTGASDVPEPVPIGKPIDETFVRVLNPELQEAGPGEAGELYTGGSGLALGYLNRPELTRERFVPDPFGSSGALMYRTGDRVVRLDDGNLRFLGRLDDQVKIDGFRVEPGEVQAAIAGLDAVLEAVVLARRLTPEVVRLAAYVRVSAVTMTVERIRAALAERLPRHLLPTFICVVDAFPMTRNGKIDRDALAALPLSAPSAESESTGSRYLDEVLRVWREQLELPKLGKDASLFDHGASSLTILVVHAKLNALFRCNVDSREVSGALTSTDWADAYRRACEGTSGVAPAAPA